MKKNKRRKVETVPPKFIQNLIDAHKEFANRLNDVIMTMKHFAAIIIVLKKKGLINDNEVQDVFNEVAGNQQDKFINLPEGSNIRPETESDVANHSGTERPKVLHSESNRDSENNIIQLPLEIVDIRTLEHGDSAAGNGED